MSDDINPDNPDGVVVAEAPVAAPEPAVVEPAALTKPDFAEHPIFAAFLAHIEEFGGAASARISQLLAEARDLMNAHGL